MKKNVLSFALLTMCVVGISCSNKKDGAEETAHTETASDEWKEMDDFHMLMAEAFHPFKDSANLEPAKQNAAALVASAEQWADAPLPEKLEGDDEVKFKINQLEKDAARFSEVVSTGDDNAIGESLTKLHNLFHAIQESWYGSHSGHHH